MDIKDTIASLQLRGTRIVNLETKNDLVNLPNGEDLDTNINLGNPNYGINETDGKLFASLQLQVRVELTDKKTDKKIYISITVEGLFSFDETDKEKFKQMLLLNGNSTLYSIVRSYIITISSIALNSEKIVLPMINFLKLAQLHKEQQDNTESK